MTKEQEQYTRRDQLQYAYDIADSMGGIHDPTELPEMVQLANEDKIKTTGLKIKIDEKFREKYLQALDQPISEGEYYMVEGMVNNILFFRG